MLFARYLYARGFFLPMTDRVNIHIARLWALLDIPRSTYNQLECVPAFSVVRHRCDLLLIPGHGCEVMEIRKNGVVRIRLGGNYRNLVIPGKHTVLVEPFGERNLGRISACAIANDKDYERWK